MMADHIIGTNCRSEVIFIHTVFVRIEARASISYN